MAVAAAVGYTVEGVHCYYSYYQATNSAPSLHFYIMPISLHNIFYSIREGTNWTLVNKGAGRMPCSFV